jgi:pSer/pThr/pTyr-binding forkhead associated (FHA) protein
MNVRLQKLGPADDGLEIRIERLPFVIGRRSDNDWALALACISRRHCQFTGDGDQVLVQDLESHNGTFVNGRRALAPLPLQHGDELSLGPIQFRVLMEAERPETDPGLETTQGDGTALAHEPLRESPRPSPS